MKLAPFDASYFRGLFGDNRYQNIFFYQTIFNTSKLKQDNDTDYVIGYLRLI